MDRDYFGQIAQAILKQKQRMEQLEAENRELRRYLDDLRTGRGIFVEISGRRFPLRDILSPRDSLAR